MAQPTPAGNQVIRTLLALTAVFVLLHLVGTTDLLSGITRPLVVGFLRLVGASAQDAAGELILGQMRVPWTRDCAGVNILILLWAMTLWSNRAEPFSGRYWLRLGLAVPAALLANICRIFTLLAYRYAFFPAVESPQLHYFIGFLWVMPCLPLLVPRSGREPGRYTLETLFLVAALSLVSPFVSAPGGNLVTLATLLLLAQSKYTTLTNRSGLLGVLWVIAAGFIALASMESLWLPWLLTCPWLIRFERLSSLPRGLLVLGTIPLVSMHPVLRWLVAAAVALEFWNLFKVGSAHATVVQATADARVWRRRITQGGLSVLFVLPFVASSATGLWRPSLRPPPGAMTREVAVNAYEVRLVGQSPDLKLIWYGPSGDGRHHTLPVCMRYRGIELKPCPEAAPVMTDGKMWMREFFIHRDVLLLDYRSYLRRTLWPDSPAGVHLIASLPVDTMSITAFANEAEALAREIHALGSPGPANRLRRATPGTVQAKSASPIP